MDVQAQPRTHKGVVFVVDDDEDVLHAIEEVLEDEGFLVLVARNGEEALWRMKGITGPSAAVVDLMMPDMNGWQLVEAMKADANLAKIPIIICSAQPSDPIPGAAMMLKKPVRAPRLLAAVKDSLKQGA